MSVHDGRRLKRWVEVEEEEGWMSEVEIRGVEGWEIESPKLNESTLNRSRLNEFNLKE